MRMRSTISYNNWTILALDRMKPIEKVNYNNLNKSQTK